MYIENVSFLQILIMICFAEEFSNVETNVWFTFIVCQNLMTTGVKCGYQRTRSHQKVNLNNYFEPHVCLSIRGSVCLSGSVRPNLTSCPASVSQNVTNKSCLVCLKSEKYASWVILRPQWDCCRRGEAEVRILNFKTTWSEFHHLPRVGPKQLCALAHLGCTRAAGTS